MSLRQRTRPTRCEHNKAMRLELLAFNGIKTCQNGRCAHGGTGSAATFLSLRTAMCNMCCIWCCVDGVARCMPVRLVTKNWCFKSLVYELLKDNPTLLKDRTGTTSHNTYGTVRQSVELIPELIPSRILRLRIIMSLPASPTICPNQNQTRRNRPVFDACHITAQGAVTPFRYRTLMSHTICGAARCCAAAACCPQLPDAAAPELPASSCCAAAASVADMAPPPPPEAASARTAACEIPSAIFP